jgi:hypothetical protein
VISGYSRRGGTLTQTQKLQNEKMEKHRATIEKCFGTFQGKFLRFGKKKPFGFSKNL